MIKTPNAPADFAYFSNQKKNPTVCIDIIGGIKTICWICIFQTMLTVPLFWEKIPIQKAKMVFIPCIMTKTDIRQCTAIWRPKEVAGLLVGLLIFYIQRFSLHSNLCTGYISIYLLLPLYTFTKVNICNNNNKSNVQNSI